MRSPRPLGYNPSTDSFAYSVEDKLNWVVTLNCVIVALAVGMLSLAGRVLL